jgi:hypothetical protein
LKILWKYIQIYKIRMLLQKLFPSILQSVRCLRVVAFFKHHHHYKVFILFVGWVLSHGLWMPRTFGLGQTNCAFGVFSAKLSAPISVKWVRDVFIVFHYSNIISTKKISLYIHIPNIYLGLGFEFRLQRIRDLVFVCP